ncbi:MAG: glycosyltransferase family A protein [Owenweeksia sp.]|nr:glycosyltransferase family A protein [Owenweeksia sp.]
MNQPFSIVIPVYNAAATLPETLASVAGQSFHGYEVILVDDGSDDDSAEIIKKWLAKHPDNTRVISQANAGLGAARNHGIAEAKNPWIAFLDADDLWHKKKLEILQKKIHKQPADVHYHAVRSFGLKRTRLRRIFQLNSLKDILIKGNPLIPSATVVKRTVLQQYPFSENQQHHGAEDLHLWLRLLHAERNFRCYGDALTDYRETGGMSTQLDHHLKQVFSVLEDLQQEGLYGNKILQRAMERKHFEAGRFLQKRSYFKEAAQYYKMSDSALKTKIIALLNRWQLAI